MSNGCLLGEEAQRDINLYYELGKRELGKGSYGTVTLALIRGTPIERAVKVINKARVSNVERFRLEVEIMMRLDHPNILRLYDYFEDSENVYLVMERCTGGELFDRIIAKKYYGEEEARIIFRQIMRAIYYCHQNGVCHRDLKPENFMMVSSKDPHTLKVIDFGLSRTFVADAPLLLQQDRLAPSPASSPVSSPVNSPARRMRRQTRAILKTKAGTPFYIAPEVLSGNYTEKCDVWSAGVILYILFCGYPPFYGENNREILEAVKRGKLDFSSTEWRDKSPAAVEIIRKMVSPHEARPFADEVLQMPFMDIKSTSVEKRRVQQFVGNMRVFAALPLAKKLLLYFIARNLYEEQLKPMHEFFHHFDKQNSGAISAESFQQTLREVDEKNDADVKKLFDALDIFDQQAIPYSLFIASAFQLGQFLDEARLHLFFLLADFDRDGKLSTRDLERFFQVQFHHRPNVPNKVRVDALREFAELGLTECPFRTFADRVRA